MESKYNLTREENIFLAKKLLVDSVWKSANLEGIAITFPQTDTILKGINVSEVQNVNDIIAIVNLKRAWQFILNNLDYPMDLSYACKINRIVGDNIVMRAGYIRDFDVSIGGTGWKPDIPNEEKIINDLKELSLINSPTKKAIETMLYLMRTQMFYDGNKRTAMLAANHIMVQNGAGIISIPVNHQIDFVSKLVKFYETNDSEDLQNFVYDKCIEGLTFTKEHNRNTQNHSRNNNFHIR